MIDHSANIHPGSLQTFYFRNGKNCPFCDEEMRIIQDSGYLEDGQCIYFCQLCGWWRSECTVHTSFPILNFTGLEMAYVFTSIQNITYMDITQCGRESTQVLRDELIRDWTKRFEIDPFRMEEVVASIFSDLGLDYILTQRSGDGGIDIFVEKDGTVFGVQVKRYKNRIEVFQIRELIGALVLSGLNHGVFVTTSDFRSGARDVAAEALRRDIRIDLIDGARLLDVLKNAQKTLMRNFEGVAPQINDGSHVLHRLDFGPSYDIFERYIWDEFRNPETSLILEGVKSGHLRIPTISRNRQIAHSQPLEEFLDREPRIADMTNGEIREYFKSHQRIHEDQATSEG